MPNDNIASLVAGRIRELREARNLSVRELARRSGMPPESISRSERELTDITLRSLAKLCSGLLVDLPTFFEFARETDVAEARSPEIERAVELLAGLAPEGRKSAVQALELLLGVGRGRPGSKPAPRGGPRAAKRKPARPRH